MCAQDVKKRGFFRRVHIGCREDSCYGALLCCKAKDQELPYSQAHIDIACDAGALRARGPSSVCWPARGELGVRPRAYYQHNALGAGRALR